MRTYKISDLSQRWGIGRTTLWRYARRGLIPVECGPRGYEVPADFVNDFDHFLQVLRGEQRRLYTALLLYRLKKSQEAIDHITGGLK